MHDNIAYMIAFWVALIGAFNWGLVGIADYNLLAVIFGTGVMATIVYALIGISALVSAFAYFQD